MSIPEPRALLGKKVRVTLHQPEVGPIVIADGKLLAFDNDGECIVQRDDGRLVHCWPMLHVEEMA